MKSKSAFCTFQRRVRDEDGLVKSEEKTNRSRMVPVSASGADIDEVQHEEKRSEESNQEEEEEQNAEETSRISEEDEAVPHEARSEASEEFRRLLILKGRGEELRENADEMRRDGTGSSETKREEGGEVKGRKSWDVKGRKNGGQSEVRCRSTNVARGSRTRKQENGEGAIY
jgi:hypothetical protein